ncbi:adenine specific DNA methylase Mod [Gluconobacter frateurii NBRC 101659]|nr:adenine specific DNA methylase Mod [Gluconobacter frateurii NBRC 101659]
MPKIKKILSNDPDTKSADIVAENIESLKTLFPDAFEERKINFDVLRQLLGGAVDKKDEKYGLNWHGKRKARQLALTPSTGTLLPYPDESVDWDTTQNLMIEGDNLEVLKLLQKSYAGKVKLIYIDPPYNTGKDFVYPDDFQDSIKNYLSLTGQIDEGGQKASSNSESSGRFHTDWLNMMYPRIKAARNLLSDDGVLFMSIDDNEVDSLKKLCSEIFGEENFIAIISVLVNPRGRHLDKFVAKTNDYLMIFARNATNLNAVVGMEKEGAMIDEYREEDERGKYRELGLRNRNQAFNPQTRPKLYYPLYANPTTGRVALERTLEFSEEVLPITPDGIQTCWTWGKDKVASENALLGAKQAGDGTWRIFRKDYLLGENGELASTLVKSVWAEKEFNNDYGRKSVKDLFGEAIMDFPKAPALMERILSIGSGESDIVLDFFAGSGTTGHAVYSSSLAGNGQRRFILVQLPEPTRRQKDNGSWEESAAYKAGYSTIAEITKERLRRAAKTLKQSNDDVQADLGFRVYKLAPSNIVAWVPEPSDLEGTLLANAEHLLPGRTEQDVLYELLLKLGLDLCVPIEKKDIAGKAVYAIGGGALIVCLADGLTKDSVEIVANGIVAWWKALAPAGETRIVFKDSSFVDDVAKANMAAILNQNGILDVRSL